MDRRLLSRRATQLAALAAVLFGTAPPQAAGAHSRGFSLTPCKTEPYAVCARPKASHAACLAILVPERSGPSPCQADQRP